MNFTQTIISIMERGMWNEARIGKYYMLAHHIVVQHKLNEQCVGLVSSTHFSQLLFSVLSTPLLSFVSFYVLLCTYSSSSVLTSPFLSLLVLLGPY